MRRQNESFRTFDHEIQLITVEEGYNENGFIDKVETVGATLLANRLSIRSNEHWQAQQAGSNLEIAFEVHAFEYNDEERLRYEGHDYKIARTYNKGELTELYCERFDGETR